MKTLPGLRQRHLLTGTMQCLRNWLIYLSLSHHCTQKYPRLDCFKNISLPNGKAWKHGAKTRLQYKASVVWRKVMDLTWTWGQRGLFYSHPESGSWKPIHGESWGSRVDPQCQEARKSASPGEILPWSRYRIQRVEQRVDESSGGREQSTWTGEDGSVRHGAHIITLAKAVHSVKLLSVFWDRASRWWGELNVFSPFAVRQVISSPPPSQLPWEHETGSANITTFYTCRK